MGLARREIKRGQTCVRDTFGTWKFSAVKVAFTVDKIVVRRRVDCCWGPKVEGSVFVVPVILRALAVAINLQWVSLTRKTGPKSMSYRGALVVGL